MTDDKPRRKLTDRQRAEAEVERARRIEDRAKRKAERLAIALTAADIEVEKATARCQYAEKHPALAGASTTTVTETGTTEAGA